MSSFWLSRRQRSRSGLCGALPRHFPLPVAGFNFVSFPNHLRLNSTCRGFSVFQCFSFSASKRFNTADEKFEDVVKSVRHAAVLVLVY